MGIVGTLASILLTILVVGLLIWIVIYPEPIKPLLNTLYPDTEYDANANAQKNGTTILYTTAASKHNKLVVVFIGGCGLFSKPSNFYGFANKLNEFLGKDDYDILLFEYPIRFKYRVLDTMLAINKILIKYIHYPIVHAVGISFGSLLAGAFYQKERTLTKSQAMEVPQIGMKFESLSIFSGMMECTFNASLMTALFRFYIMRNTPGIINYTCYGMALPKMVISANTDFLVAQTAKFIQTESAQYKIYDTKALPHAFCQYINLDDAIDAISTVAKFIRSVDNGRGGQQQAATTPETAAAN